MYGPLFTRPSEYRAKYFIIGICIQYASSKYVGTRIVFARSCSFSMRDFRWRTRKRKEEEGFSNTVTVCPRFACSRTLRFARRRGGPIAENRIYRALFAPFSWAGDALKTPVAGIAALFQLHSSATANQISSAIHS